MCIENKIEDIDRYLKDQEKVAGESYYDDSLKKKTILEVGVIVRNYLEYIFGKESDIKSKGLIGSDIMPYKEYSDSIAYSYWSFRGESDKYYKESKGSWRYNFFYKGQRWSNKELKNNFYDIFKLFEKVTDGGNPVDYFIELGLRRGLTAFKVSMSDNDVKKESVSSCINIPILKTDDYSDKIQEFIDLINSFKDILEISRGSGKFKNKLDQIAKSKFGNKEQLAEGFYNLYCAAVDAFVSSHNSVIASCKNDFLNVFGLDNDDPMAADICICKIIFTMQLFDHPYDIHFFLPEKSDYDVSVSKSCLFITTMVGADISPIKDYLKALINVLRTQQSIEKIIVDRIEKLLPFYWKFKDEYQKSEVKYKVLCSIAINILRAIEQENELGLTYITDRVKTFDSLFHKVLKTANERDGKRLDALNELSSTRELTKDEEKTKTHLSSASRFYEIINKGRAGEVEKIISDIHDTAGVRAICLFQDDEGIIKDVLAKLFKEGELEKKDEEEKRIDDNKGYRSTHYTICLGEKRKSIYEFKYVSDLLFELQVRTLLGDVWANASHEMIYKHNYPEAFMDNAIMNEKVNELIRMAGTFEVHDKHIKEIRAFIFEQKRYWEEYYR